MLMCVISGFRCEVDEKCALLGYYAASSDNFLPGQIIDSIFMGQESKIIDPEDRCGRLSRNLVINYHYSLRNDPEERSTQICYY